MQTDEYTPKLEHGSEKKLFAYSIIFIIFKKRFFVFKTLLRPLVHAYNYKKLVASAEKGNADDQMKLGSMYQFGTYVEQDYGKALYWYTKAAMQGNNHAQCYLGELYEYGHGVKQSNEKAFEWYQKAAEGGDAYAQNSIGWMYEQGDGVEQDYAKALLWYKHAALQGEINGEYNLGMMYNLGKGVPQNYREAFKWFHEAAQKEHGAAQANLAALYFDGLGTYKNEELAMEYYQKSATHGFAPAQSFLGRIAEANKEIDNAIMWYRKASEQGESTALVNLGLIYELGEGVVRHEIIAYALIEMAVQRGNEMALDIRATVTKGMNSAKIEEAKALMHEPEKLWALMDTLQNLKVK